MKRRRVRSWLAPLPTGNPGSATDYGVSNGLQLCTMLCIVIKPPCYKYSQHRLIQILVIQPIRLIGPFPLRTSLTPYVKQRLLVSVTSFLCLQTPVSM